MLVVSCGASSRARRRRFHPPAMADPDAVYVGLMSGTSLDGVSAAVVRFEDGPPLTHTLLGFTHVAYTPGQRERLASAMRGATAAEYCALSFDLGGWLADAALAAMADARVTAVRAIASHGQTLWHIPRRATWQLGETAVIAERTGVDVIGDFRVRDVAAGGEGAPLVPMADALLYADPDRARLLQNLGGIANVTVVPAGGNPAHVTAFDTGPGVAVLDSVARMVDGALPYDRDGAIAAHGSVCAPVLNTLLGDPYFGREPPKSTGREHFGADFARRLRDAVHAEGGSDADAVATAAALTARSILLSYHRFIPRSGDAEVVVSGGGTRHPVLMRMLAEGLTAGQLRRFDDLYYDAEAKEGVAFALLAHLHLADRAGNVIGATGARGPRILGKLTPA